MTTESLLTRTKKLLKSHDLRARKGLAQHFLVDGGMVKKILVAADLSPADTVIEVGPGLGVLTEGLVKAAGRVIAIELDARLSQLLKEKLVEAANLTVVNEDVLKTDPQAVLGGGREYKVVANLPYYITSAVTRHFLEASVKPRLLVIMVQKQVAKQITAAPGEMSLLSVSVQLYGKPKIVTTVPARAFYPAPKVDSAVLRIDVYPQPRVAGHDITGFFTLVRAGFSAARKQLPNALANGLVVDKAKVLPWLEEAGIDPHRRAETLTIEEWGRLFEVYESEAKPDDHG